MQHEHLEVIAGLPFDISMPINRSFTVKPCVAFTELHQALSAIMKCDNKFGILFHAVINLKVFSGLYLES